MNEKTIVLTKYSGALLYMCMDEKRPLEYRFFDDEEDAVGREACELEELNLSDTHGVRIETLFKDDLEDREVRVGLHREIGSVRELLNNSRNISDALSEDALIIDIYGSAVLGNDVLGVVSLKEIHLINK